MTDFSEQIIPSASVTPTLQEKSLKLPKSIHSTMKQSKKLKLKLSESQLDVGSLIDPKIDLKHKAVNEVERWALDSAYGTVYHNVDKRMSNASSIGNCQIALALSKITTQQFFCGVGKIFPYCHHLQK